MIRPASKKPYAAVQARHRRVRHKSLGGTGVTIQDAIHHPGALTAKAQAAGQSVHEYAVAHQHDSGQTGDQARFYLNVLRPANKNRGAR